MKKNVIRKLVEGALLVAVATVLSMLKFDLPFGGGVTIVSMLPIVFYSHPTPLEENGHPMPTGK